MYVVHRKRIQFDLEEHSILENVFNLGLDRSWKGSNRLRKFPGGLQNPPAKLLQSSHDGLGKSRSGPGTVVERYKGCGMLSEKFQDDSCVCFALTPNSEHCG